MYGPSSQHCDISLINVGGMQMIDLKVLIYLLAILHEANKKLLFIFYFLNLIKILVDLISTIRKTQRERGNILTDINFNI